MNADFARGGAGMNDDGRDPSCEIQVASGALVGVTRGPRRERLGLATFAGFGAAGAFGAGAATGFAGAGAGFVATGFAALIGAAGFGAGAAFFGAAAAFGAAAGFFAGFAASFAGFATGLGAGFAPFFGAALIGFAAAFADFTAGFAGFAADFAVFAAGFAVFTGFFATTGFFGDGFAAADFAFGANFLTVLDLPATLPPEVAFLAVVVDALSFARAMLTPSIFRLSP